MDTYREANPRKRRNALPYLQAIYRRWYYSTLVEDAPLSPANILDSICRYHNKPAALHPVARMRGKAKLMGIDMELVEYSLDNHPVVGDMRLLIEYCTPHIDLGEGDVFLTASALELGAKLTLNDPHYAAYLLEVALRMKLIVKMPSVGVNRFRPGQNKAPTLTERDLLGEIIDTTISIAARGLQDLIMLPESFFTPAFIRDLLTTPMETDEIFAQVYDVLGYDLNDLVDITMDLGSDLDGTDVDLLAGTFMTGVLLDKFFFTPFGHFLKLIRPLYVLPFEFEGEITDYVDSSDDPEESIIAFFAPCSNYTLTDMGLEYFQVEKSDDNYIDTTEIVPFDQMKDTVLSSKEALCAFAAVAKHLAPLRLGQDDQLPEEVYTFRVRLETDPAIWAHLQMPKDATLDDMYTEITEILELKDNGNYSFFHDKEENRFAEYAAPRRTKRPGGKASDAELGSLDFEHQKQMLLAAYNQSAPFVDEDPTVRVQLELLHKKPPEIGHEYPRVSRVSKGLRSEME